MKTMTHLTIEFRKDVDITNIIEEIRETIEDKFGIQIVEINNS